GPEPTLSGRVMRRSTQFVAPPSSPTPPPSRVPDRLPHASLCSMTTRFESQVQLPIGPLGKSLRHPLSQARERTIRPPSTSTRTIPLPLLPPLPGMPGLAWLAQCTTFTFACAQPTALLANEPYVRMPASALSCASTRTKRTSEKPVLTGRPSASVA